MVLMIFSGSGSSRKDTYDCDEYEANSTYLICMGRDDCISNIEGHGSCY